MTPIQKYKNKFNFVGVMGHRLCLILSAFLFSVGSLHAHSSDVDFFRATGKIYVVVGVVLIVFLGMVFFLFHLQKKLTNLEKQIDHERSE